MRYSSFLKSVLCVVWLFTLGIEPAAAIDTKRSDVNLDFLRPVFVIDVPSKAQLCDVVIRDYC